MNMKIKKRKEREEKNEKERVKGEGKGREGKGREWGGRRVEEGEGSGLWIVQHEAWAVPSVDQVLSIFRVFVCEVAILLFKTFCAHNEFKEVW
jgi:hypothetical protein